MWLCAACGTEMTRNEITKNHVILTCPTCNTKCTNKKTAFTNTTTWDFSECSERTQQAIRERGILT